MSELIRLADGTTVVVRPMRRDDGPAVRDGFRSLSLDSLRRRFFSPAPRLTPELLDELTRVDPAGRIVLLAFETDTGRLAGGARAIRLPADPGAADIAITVGDACQGRGLGSALLRELHRAARSQGIERFTGNVLVDNGPAKRMLRSAGAHLEFDEPGVLRFEIPVLRRGVRVPVAA
jgi:ribosomal protein S18 acetylase RimI-like enzyme